MLGAEDRGFGESESSKRAGATALEASVTSLIYH
jgi:hypothetical protein